MAVRDPAPSRTYAVSTVTQKPDGVVEHALCLVEADTLDAAEARVLAQALSDGRRIRGLLSRACTPDGD